MSLDSNKTYLVWNGTAFPNSTIASFKAPAGSTIDWGDGTVETFNTASTTINKHTYTDGKTEHTIAISGLTSIDVDAFSFCDSLMSITISNSVTSIRDGAFNHCGSLMSVAIPDGVTSIGMGTFSNCTNLKQLILFQSTPPTLGSYAIPNNVQSIYVQQSSKAAYQAATNWTTFASKIVSDNIYLSFVRFNQKNKEYIDSKVNERLTAPTTPTADSVVTMLANGTTGTKALSEFSGKLYCHKVTVNVQYSPTQSMSVVLNNIYNPSQTALTTKELLSPYMTSIGIGCISDFQSESEGTGSPTSVGCILINNNTSASVILFGTVTSDSAFGTVSDNYNINSIIDTVTEL